MDYNRGNSLYIRLNTHKLLESTDVLHILILHDLLIRHLQNSNAMKPILQEDSDRVDSLQGG